MDSQNRDSVRLRSLLGATIIHSDGAVTTECKARDISPTGARLVVSPHVVLPQRFDLHIPTRRETRPCRLIWIHDGHCGVEFLDQRPPGPDGPNEDLPRRILRLEAENAALRTEIDRLRRELQGRIDRLEPKSAIG